MDDDIKDENKSIDSDKLRRILEYKPKRPIITSTDNTFATLNDKEERAEVIIKKIRNDRKQSNVITYPWEDLNYDDVDNRVPVGVDKKYQKRTFIVSPSRLREITASGKITVASYITVNNYSERPKQEDEYGKPDGFKQKSPSKDIDDGLNHTIYQYGTKNMNISGDRLRNKSWQFKYVPGSSGYGIERADGSTKLKPIPGIQNGKIPNRLLAKIKATLGPNSSESKILYAEAADSFNRMYDAALKDGIKIYVTSGYRDYNHQASLYSKRTRRGGVAKPGGSNHGWGKAIDIWPAGFANQEAYINGLAKNDFSALNKLGFTKSQYESAKKWVNMNGDRFGWYWGDAWNEDWHFVYVW